MEKYVEINYQDIEKNSQYEELIKMVIKRCFEIENINNKNLYVNVILTNPNYIQKVNCQYRNIDKPTDVLSFPMFEKNEIISISDDEEEVLGDIIISIEKVEEQAIEYGHSFERELSYMIVHGFYHLMGYDHIDEQDKLEMRKKEENVLCELEITRSK